MRSLWVALFLAFCGCGERPPTEPAGTGAKETAQAFFDGLIAKDSRRAYDVLESESRRKMPFEQFQPLASNYLGNVGFSPSRVQIQSRDEQGDSAIVHVVLIGHSAGHSRRYSEGITLRRGDGHWGVVLPANFGRKTK